MPPVAVRKQSTVGRPVSTRHGIQESTDIAATEQPIKSAVLEQIRLGLYDMGGGVDQWVEIAGKNYQGAPSDGHRGSRRLRGRMSIRSGSGRMTRAMRARDRDNYDTNVRFRRTIAGRSVS